MYIFVENPPRGPLCPSCRISGRRRACPDGTARMCRMWTGAETSGLPAEKSHSWPFRTIYIYRKEERVVWVKIPAVGQY